MNIWTAGFATQYSQVTGSLDGATDYDPGSESGTGGSSYYGDFGNPKEQYLYTFNVLADTAGDVFNFSINTAGTTGASRHVLINAASISVIPEPSTLALVSIVAVGFIAFGRRRWK